MTTSETETSPAPALELAQEADDESGREAVVDEAPGRSAVDRARSYAPAGGAAAAGAVAFLVAARLVGRRQREEEHVLFSSRPRKVFWRYVRTLGLWELTRRATQFTVTDRFVVVDRGVLRRSSQALPLSMVRAVHVASGPWQGFVEVRGAGGSEVLERRLGPLRTPKARELAAIIGREIVR